MKARRLDSGAPSSPPSPVGRERGAFRIVQHFPAGGPVSAGLGKILSHCLSASRSCFAGVLRAAANVCSRVESCLGSLPHSLRFGKDHSHACQRLQQVAPQDVRRRKALQDREAVRPASSSSTRSKAATCFPSRRCGSAATCSSSRPTTPRPTSTVSKVGSNIRITEVRHEHDLGLRGQQRRQRRVPGRRRQRPLRQLRRQPARHAPSATAATTISKATTASTRSSAATATTRSSATAATTTLVAAATTCADDRHRRARGDGGNDARCMGESRQRHDAAIGQAGSSTSMLGRRRQRRASSASTPRSTSTSTAAPATDTHVDRPHRLVARQPSSATSTATWCRTCAPFANGADRTLNGDRIADPTLAASATRLVPARSQDNPLFSSARPADDRHHGKATSATAGCWPASAPIAHDNPHAIRQNVVDFDDGTYGVRLGNSFYRVDNDLPVDTPPSTRHPAYAKLGAENSMWVAVVEKAFAHYRTGANSYASLDGGWSIEVNRAFRSTLGRREGDQRLRQRHGAGQRHCDPRGTPTRP